MSFVRVPLAAGALLLFAAAGAPAETRTILPGYWEYKSDVLGSAKTDMRCVRPDEIDKFFAGPQPGHYNCSYPVRRVGDGAAKFVGVCIGKKHGERVPLSVSGQYQPTSFTLHGTLQATLGVLTLPIAVEISARRVAAACPAE